ncbi:hypothetical protein CE91St62_32640 [Lachnospiraceae bacterium]|nr:hypothetical protein CE91St61_32770 [Lachnospiraceae bacterium]BDF39203.1 hypothetical protein CE91St62_32640 [Lachnospiraceae bacterium]
MGYLLPYGPFVGLGITQTLGNMMATRQVYYITLWGSKIDTGMVCDRMGVQKRIKQLMEEWGWTDYQLAKEANLSHPTISNMFNRNNAFTIFR